MFSLILVLGCVQAPQWAVDCNCSENNICLDGSTCVPVPTACEPAFLDRCEPSAIDDTCELALCGQTVLLRATECFEGEVDGTVIVQKGFSCDGSL